MLEVNRPTISPLLVRGQVHELAQEAALFQIARTVELEKEVALVVYPFPLAFPVSNALQQQNHLA